MTSDSNTLAVATSHGAVRGRREGSLAVFRGIPYAQPPIGELRFRPPREVAAWKGERDAFEFSPVPPQKSEVIAERLGLFPAQAQSEDCLALNVWSPGVERGSRPVLVWIHGGAFIQGAGCVPLYAGAQLAKRADAVVVTLNYRVGALGFLHIPGEERGSNFGLQDQLAALRWVKREIANFGGDPDRVTVFGESAGAGSIISLLAMPAARGLFRRAIVQSASPEGMLDAAEAERRSGLLLAKLGLTPGDFEALRRVPTPVLQQAQAELAAAGPYQKGMLYLPVVDGVMLPKFPLEAIAAGSAAQVDVMIGTTRDEMRLFNWTTPPAAITAALLEVIVAAQLPATVEDTRAEAQRIIARYRELRAARGEAGEPADLFCAIQTDLSMRHPSTQLASLQAGFNPNTYMYLFAWPSPCDGGALGSCHALDIPFVLGNLDAPGMADFAGSGPAAQELADRTMDAWAAFARDGDPSGGAGRSWPRYDATTRHTMQIDASWQLQGAPFESERAIWEAISPTSRFR